jgi:uncharacterized protein (TIGR03083 family)
MGVEGSAEGYREWGMVTGPGRAGDNGAGQDGVWRQLGLEAMTGLQETWESLAEACRELSVAEWALPTECPGWDVKDQLSHLIGVERAIMGEATPDWDGNLGDHVKNDFGVSNEPFIAVRRARPGTEIFAEFVDVTSTRLAQETGRTEQEWAAVGWSPVGQRPHAVFMEVRVFDSWVHEQDVRRALDRPGGSGNVASAMALNRVQEAMPFVVGKKAACPDGTAVRFEVEGSGRDARTFTIAVEEGRAKPVDEAVVPTVALFLSSLDFMRLGCGRTTAAQLAEQGQGVVVAGDESVGDTVLGAMNFMF